MEEEQFLANKTESLKALAKEIQDCPPFYFFEGEDRQITLADVEGCSEDFEILPV